MQGNVKCLASPWTARSAVGKAVVSAASCRRPIPRPPAAVDAVPAAVDLSRRGDTSAVQAEVTGSPRPQPIRSPAVHDLSQSDHRQSTASANQITGSPRPQPIRPAAPDRSTVTFEALMLKTLQMRYDAAAAAPDVADAGRRAEGRSSRDWKTVCGPHIQVHAGALPRRPVGTNTAERAKLAQPDVFTE